MKVLVDTSVWSLLLRRDGGQPARESSALRRLIEQGADLWLVGSVLQEVLQGFHDLARFERLKRALASYPLLALGRDDFERAADIRNRARSAGVQIGTVDAQIASSAIGHDAILLTADADFKRIARLCPLRLL